MRRVGLSASGELLVLCVTGLLLNNEIRQSILTTYMALLAYFARAKFTYSCVAFLTILDESSKCLAILH